MISLDEMEELEKACTKGSWKSLDIMPWNPQEYGPLGYGKIIFQGNEVPFTFADAKFIGKARDFVPWAIKRIRQLEANEKALRAMLKCTREEISGED